jgi:hypothetical protein
VTVWWVLEISADGIVWTRAWMEVVATVEL